MLLDEFHRAICAGGDRLHGCAGEPINHRAAGNQTQQEGRVEDGEVGKVGGQAVGERHNDGEDHSGRADDRSADQHWLGGCLEARQRLDGRKLEHGLGVIGHGTVAIHRDGHRTHTEESESHQAEGKHGRRHHQAGEPQGADSIGDAHQAEDGEAQPVGAEVAGHQTGQNAQ